MYLRSTFVIGFTVLPGLVSSNNPLREAWIYTVPPQVESGDRCSDFALFFSQKSGDPLAEFLLVVQITVQNCMNPSSWDVNPLRQLLARLSSIFGQQHFDLLDILWTWCIRWSSWAFVVFHARPSFLEESEPPLNGLLRKSVVLEDSFKLSLNFWRPFSLQEQELHGRSNVLLPEWFYHADQVKVKTQFEFAAAPFIESPQPHCFSNWLTKVEHY